MSALNHKRVINFKTLASDSHDMSETTRQENLAKAIKRSQIEGCKWEAFKGDLALCERPKDASESIQCKPVDVLFQDSGITHVNRARGRCGRCPKLFQPGLKTESTSHASFYSFLGLPRCSKYGPFKPENDLCPSCSEKDNNDGPPTVTKRKHLALQRKKITNFGQILKMQQPNTKTIVTRF